MIKHTPIRMRSTGSARVLAAVAIVVLVAGLIPGSARAGAPERQAYTAASAYRTDCVTELARTLCTETSLNVYTALDGSNVCLYVSHYALSSSGEYTSISSESGCAPVENAFTIDTTRLSSAMLAPTTVTLNAYDCTESGCQLRSSREVTVAATFTGTGKVSNFRNHGKSYSGPCAYIYTGKGIGRDASASITLDSRTVEAAGYLSSSTSQIKVQCHT